MIIDTRNEVIKRLGGKYGENQSSKTSKQKKCCILF